jgi:DNA modification methylase
LILQGDSLQILETLDSASVHTCITSPPYWGLRDYGVEGQLGLEATPDEYVANLVRLFSEVKRVLRDDGTLWLNLGDSYATGAGSARVAGGKMFGKANYLVEDGHVAKTQPNRMPQKGLKPKDLVGIPWRVAFALQADGWYLRQDIIWHKPNPMPESVRDRCTKAHEYIFLLSKSKKYYFDADSIRQPHKRLWDAKNGCNLSAEGLHKLKGEMNTRKGSYPLPNPKGANKRSVWTVTTKPFKEAHFATFPPDLIEPCVLAGAPKGGVVLDPFFGAGTTGVVAAKHDRECIGIELNPEYAEIAGRRLAKGAS